MGKQQQLGLLHPERDICYSRECLGVSMFAQWGIHFQLRHYLLTQNGDVYPHSQKIELCGYTNKNVTPLGDIYLFNFFLLFIYFCLRWVSAAAHGPSPAAASGGSLVTVARGPLTVVASATEDHGLQVREPQQLQHAGPAVVALGLTELRLSSCGTRAQLLCGMRDPPGPGVEPVSPALAGRLPTTAPLGKPSFGDIK